MKTVWLNAQKQFESFWLLKTQYCYAFEDTREAMGLAGSRKVFTKGRPSDYLVTEEGRTFFAEVKSSQHLTSFSLSNIAAAQWRCSTQITYAGGLYFFFIRQELTHQWYCVPAQVMIQTNRIKKSLKWDELSIYKWEPQCNNTPT